MDRRREVWRLLGSGPMNVPMPMPDSDVPGQVDSRVGRRVQLRLQARTAVLSMFSTTRASNAG